MMDILLISMPFGPVTTPSIALGLLKAILRQQGMQSKALYFNLELARRMSTRDYETVSISQPEQLVGEWLFSKSLFATSNRSVETLSEFFANCIDESTVDPELFRAAQSIEPLIAQFIDDCLDDVMRHAPKIVGFTSNFQQQIASLSLAKRIKEKDPTITIVFGGANLEGTMGVEVIRQFPFVDAVVSGEADLVIVDLFQRMLDGRCYSDIPGVYTQQNVDLCLLLNGQEPSNAEQVRRMDALPTPEYDDFFAAFAQLAVADDPTDPNYAVPRILMQTARGCWWGDTQHCTFCPINDSSINYRSMSSDRALQEILALSNRYPGVSISSVDYILEMRYFKDLLPKLIELDLGLDIFYEIKANLKREHVRMLRDAGIWQVQPGIENFNDHVLSLIRKGTTGLQNIALLRWCKEYGVDPGWSILWGFPGETAEDYAAVADLLPKIVHVKPPEVATPFRMDRFGPNFVNAEAMGFSDLQPFPAYRHCYAGLTEQACFNLAYYFTYRHRQPYDISAQTEQIKHLVSEWKAEHQRSDLFFVDKGDFLLFFDTRPNSTRVFRRIDEPLRTLYLLCDTMRSPRQLVKQAIETDFPLTETEIRCLLQPLLDFGLMVYDKDKDLYLSLAISTTEGYSPTPEVWQRMRELAGKTGELVGDQFVIPA